MAVHRAIMFRDAMHQRRSLLHLKHLNQLTWTFLRRLVRRRTLILITTAHRRRLHRIRAMLHKHRTTINGDTNSIIWNKAFKVWAHRAFIDDRKSYVSDIVLIERERERKCWMIDHWIVNENDNSMPSNSPSQYGTTPEATKKSLFHHIIDAMQEDHHMIVVKDRPLAAIKTDLIHAFLSVGLRAILLFPEHSISLQTPDLVHNVLSGTQYRCEYRRPDRSSMFQRNIRFHVEICTVKSIDASAPDSYYVTFTLITGKKLDHCCTRLRWSLVVGQARRFKKLCEEIQVLFLTSKERLAKQRRIPPPSENRSQPSPSAYSTTTTVSQPANPSTPMTARSNASFISSLFGNTNSACKCRQVAFPLQKTCSACLWGVVEQARWIEFVESSSERLRCFVFEHFSRESTIISVEVPLEKYFPSTQFRCEIECSSSSTSTAAAAAAAIIFVIDFLPFIDIQRVSDESFVSRKCNSLAICHSFVNQWWFNHGINTSKTCSSSGNLVTFFFFLSWCLLLRVCECLIINMYMSRFSLTCNLSSFHRHLDPSLVQT